MSAYDIARDISDGLARAACMAEIDGKAVDLRTMVDRDCELNILTFDSDEGKRAYRHTCSHVLAEAVKNLYPDAKLAIGPSIENGFYYDFDMPPLTREDLDKIEAEMKKIIKKGDRLEYCTKRRMSLTRSSSSRTFLRTRLSRSTSRAISSSSAQALTS